MSDPRTADHDPTPEETRPNREEQRDQVLEAALVHIPFDGWSQRSLFNGAADLGLDRATARRLFPRGGDDLLAHLDRWADRAMLARLETMDLQGLRIRDRIQTLVMTRLEVLTPHREAVRRALAARLLPTNTLGAASAVWASADAMWRAAGDESADSSYYSKRGLLAAVWSSTLLYWLEDESPELEGTRTFLKRRIEQVMKVSQLRGRIETLVNRFNPLAARRS